METKVVSEARGAEVESEPGAEFQPLLWDVDVGRRLCTGTVVAYLSLFALVTSSLRTCGEPDSTQKSSCFGAAAMMLTAFGMACVRIPVSFIGGFLLKGGLLGAWSGMFADLTVRSILITNRFRAGKWKKVRV